MKICQLMVQTQQQTLVEKWNLFVGENIKKDDAFGIG